MNKSRGFSLVLVLLVASVVLVIGAAIAVMTTLSLNMTSRLLGQTKGELLGRAIAAQLRYELDRRVWLEPNPYPGGAAIAYPDMSLAEGVKKRFQLPLFPDPTPRVLDGTHVAWVDFDDTRSCYSTDNLNSDDPVHGWLDQGTTNKTVPPYSLSLVIHTGNGDTPRNVQDHRCFHALIRRTWPYAAYSLNAPTTIGLGTRIQGNVYGYRDKVTVGTTNAPGLTPSATILGDVKSGLPEESAPLQVLPDALVQGRTRYGVPFIRGPGNEKEAMALLGFQANVPGQGDAYVDVGPEMPQGSARVTAAISSINLKQLEAMLVWIRTMNRAGPIGRFVNLLNESILSLVDKINLFVMNPSDPEVPFLRVSWEQAASLIRFKQGTEGEVVGVDLAYTARQFDDEKFHILLDDLNLSDGVYHLDKSLLNHFVTGSGATLYTGTTHPAKIRLENAILRVDGDLDVSDVYGVNSALYVNGDLYLAGGTLSSGDKGMLILANNIRVDARGVFKGLISAKNTINFMPGDRRRPPLVIQGAVLAGGMFGSTRGNQIQNTTINLDPRYLKALNRLGTATTVIFQDIPWVPDR